MYNAGKGIINNLGNYQKRVLYTINPYGWFIIGCRLRSRKRRADVSDPHRSCQRRQWLGEKKNLSRSGISWEINSFKMENSWDFMGKSWENHGKSMGNSWEINGISSGKSWEVNVKFMGFIGGFLDWEYPKVIQVI